LRKSPRKKILGTKMRQSWYQSKTPNIKIMKRKRKLRNRKERGVFYKLNKTTQRVTRRELPGSPVIRTQCVHCQDQVQILVRKLSCMSGWEKKVGRGVKQSTMGLP